MPQTGSAHRHGAEDLRRRDDHAAAHDLPQTRLRLRPVMILQTATECHRAPHQPQAAADRRELHEQLQHLVHQIHSRTPPHRNGTARRHAHAYGHPHPIHRMSAFRNQLLILGNGFDLECNLQSRFVDYFKTREEKPWLLPIIIKWRENPNDPENVWDHIFLREKESNPGDWKDVESLILKWILKDKLDDFRDATASITRRYGFFKTLTLGLENSKELPIRVTQIRSVIEMRKLLFSQLQLFEQAFERYLINEASSQAYIENAHQLYKALASASVNNDTYNNFVLSFNYTAPQPSSPQQIPSDHLCCWRNVHGRLGMSNLIFGIDINELDEEQQRDPSIRQFTKTYRTLKLSNIKNNALLLRHGRLFDNIKFYGHSLGKADYSYFKAIFDFINLYDSGTKLIFYYPSDRQGSDEELYPKIADLLTDYGQSLPDKSKGKNLMHKLLLEERLSLQELDVSSLNLL